MKTLSAPGWPRLVAHLHQHDMTSFHFAMSAAIIKLMSLSMTIMTNMMMNHCNYNYGCVLIRCSATAVTVTLVYISGTCLLRHRWKAGCMHWLAAA